jgi:hypothetical protein
METRSAMLGPWPILTSRRSFSRSFLGVIDLNQPASQRLQVSMTSGDQDLAAIVSAGIFIPQVSVNNLYIPESCLSAEYHAA